MILDKFSLECRVAIVTGSGQGIGKAIALGLAQAGANVVVADKDVGLGEIVVGDIEALGRNALLSNVDVRESEQVNGMVQECMLKFGRVDILVNNAGGFFVAPVMEISEKGWDAVVRMNLKSTFLCSKAVAGIMMEKKKGVILNIASSSGEGPSPGSAHYGAAKAGVINLTM